MFSGKVRPNGMGSFGFVRRKGEQARERTASSDRKGKILAVNYLDYDEYEGENNTTRVVRCSYKSVNDAPLTLSEPLIGRTAKKRVAKGLTTAGKRKMESAIHLLAHKYGTRNLGFYTLTCPFTEPEDVDAFNQAFPTIIKRYLEKVKRHYAKKGKQFSYVGVHEVQTRRFASTGIGALHFHYIAPCSVRFNGGFICSAGEIRDWFCESIRNALPGRHCDGARVGAEVCRKSASAYLAKYYSKGVEEDAGKLGRTAPIQLSSWYVMCRSLLNAVTRCTFRVHEHLANDVISHTEGTGNNADITFSRAIKVCRDGRDVLVGYVFAMSAKFMSAWLRHCMQEVSCMF